MKLHFILSLFVALFISGSVYAQRPIGSLAAFDDELILKGEFSDTGSRSLDPIVPIIAGISDNVMYVQFAKAFGSVQVSVQGEAKCVYSSTLNVTTADQIISFSIDGYKPGIYLLEFRNSKGGYVCGQFIVE